MDADPLTGHIKKILFSSNWRNANSKSRDSRFGTYFEQLEKLVFLILTLSNLLLKWSHLRKKYLRGWMIKIRFVDFWNAKNDPKKGEHKVNGFFYLLKKWTTKLDGPEIRKLDGFLNSRPKCKTGNVSDINLFTILVNMSTPTHTISVRGRKFVSSSFEMSKKFVKQTYYLNAICEQQTVLSISIKSHVFKIFQNILKNISFCFSFSIIFK